jgi:ABC-2 type transport system permease protein
MNKLKYLTKISLNKKIKTKWFLWANIILFIVIIGLINIDSIIKLFGGDFNNDTNILVIDNTNYLYDDLNTIYLEYASSIDTNTTLTQYTKTYEEALVEIENTDNMILVINEDATNYLNANLVAESYIDSITSELLSYALNSLRSNLALEKYNLSSDILNDINSSVTLTKTILDTNNTNDTETDLIMNVIFPILILPFFMLTMFLVQMIGAEINEEKTTKSMEIIISNVSPRTHFASKLLAGNIFVLFQGLLLIIYLTLGVILRLVLGGGQIADPSTSSLATELIASLNTTGLISNLKYIIPISLTIMILTFIAYSLIAAILASMTTNIEDFQQVQTPIIVVSLLGYYLAILAAMFNGSLFIRILSYLPFISALLVPSLLALGQIGVLDVIISLSLLIITIYLLFKYGLKIYKVGILNYSSNNIWKKMFKAIKRENYYQKGNH